MMRQTNTRGVVKATVREQTHSLIYEAQMDVAKPGSEGRVVLADLVAVKHGAVSTSMPRPATIWCAVERLSPQARPPAPFLAPVQHDSHHERPPLSQHCVRAVLTGRDLLRYPRIPNCQVQKLKRPSLSCPGKKAVSNNLPTSCRPTTMPASLPLLLTIFLEPPVS